MGLGIVATALVGVAPPSWAAVTPATLTPSATQGPNTGGNTITATTPVGSVPLFPGVDVEFQAVAAAAAACSAVYSVPVPSTATVGGVFDLNSVMVISANRLSINVPNFGAAALTSKYNICVYSAANPTGQLLAQTSAAGIYSIGTRLLVNNVWPAAGPSQGGTLITVFGINFPTTSTAATAAPVLTATLGGLPLLNVTVVSANTFTAVTPAHTPGPTPVSLILTSASGTTILGRAFTYANGITVSPNTGPNTRMGGTPVDVQGIGFGGLNFMMTGNPDDKNPHVYLVRGAYDPTIASGAKKNGELAECANVIVVSDTELVCTMNLQASLTATGTTATPTRTIIADTHTDTTLANIVPPLSPSDQGERISGPGIAPGTVVTDVAPHGTSATLSLATLATTTAVSAIAIGIGSESATINARPTAPTRPRRCRRSARRSPRPTWARRSPDPASRPARPSSTSTRTGRPPSSPRRPRSRPAVPTAASPSAIPFRSRSGRTR